MIRLSADQVSSLRSQPESGMGYQLVEAEYRGRLQKGTVFNAELLRWDGEPPIELKETHETLLRTANAAEAQFITSLSVVPAKKAVAGFVSERLAGEAPGKPATGGAVQQTNAGELFARFTAYMNDRRITATKGLLPGTYGTTDADAKKVATGSEAVKRYALPDPNPAIYKFKIAPLVNTPYRQGIVQPAFGHHGGGVEVIFDKGTDDNTVSGPAVLPP